MRRNGHRVATLNQALDRRQPITTINLHVSFELRMLISFFFCYSIKYAHFKGDLRNLGDNKWSRIEFEDAPVKNRRIE